MNNVVEMPLPLVGLMQGYAKRTADIAARMSAMRTDAAALALDLGKYTEKLQKELPDSTARDALINMALTQAQMLSWLATVTPAVIEVPTEDQPRIALVDANGVPRE